MWKSKESENVKDEFVKDSMEILFNRSRNQGNREGIQPDLESKINQDSKPFTFLNYPFQIHLPHHHI
jgi:hypothetical protein